MARKHESPVSLLFVRRTTPPPTLQYLRTVPPPDFSCPHSLPCENLSMWGIVCPGRQSPSAFQGHPLSRPSSPLFGNLSRSAGVRARWRNPEPFCGEGSRASRSAGVRARWRNPEPFCGEGSRASRSAAKDPVRAVLRASEPAGLLFTVSWARPALHLAAVFAASTAIF